MTSRTRHEQQVAPPRGVERALEPRRVKFQAEFERLVTAAREVMGARGTVDPTVAEILAVAGLSTNAFYRHFATKEDLLLELLVQAGANTRSYLAHRMAGHDDPPARIRSWIEGMFDLLRTETTLAANRPFLLAHPRLVEHFPAEIAASAGLVIQPLAEAIRELRGGTADEAVADARLVYHQVFGILLDRAAMRQLRDTDEVERVVAYSLRALADR